MRRLGPPSEIRRLASPLAHLLDVGWQRMHWWVGLMALLYLVSGITFVKPDEVAVILRWGRLVGDTPALQEHGPGVLFAFPRPMDYVVRVPVKHVAELDVTSLVGYDYDDDDPYKFSTLDPVTQGYAVTGDENTVYVQVVARYRIRDAAEWAFYGPNAEDVLWAEVTSAMTRSLGEMNVDRVLSDGRQALLDTATRRVQAGLDAAHAGLELSSLELVDLHPPLALAGDFEAVQSAYIGSETSKKVAEAYAAGSVPEAQTQVDTETQAARGVAAADLARAKGEAEAFLALNREYRVNPVVVRERLYRDAVEKAIATATVRWVPPPTNGKYNGLRITVAPAGTGAAPSGSGPGAIP